MNCFRLVACISVFVAFAPAWAINKCTGADGKTVFQDMPCEVKSPASRDDFAELRRAANTPEAKAAVAEQKETMRRMNEAAAQSAVANRKAEQAQAEAAQVELERICNGQHFRVPTIGMPELVFRKCTDLGADGAADQVNETESVSGTSRQYVYRKAPAGIRYVYTQQGVVTTIQRLN